MIPCCPAFPRVGFLTLAVASLAAATATAAPTAPTGSLRAGAAKAEVTPLPAMFPLTAGQTYGSVHDPLYARAIVLTNGKEKFAFIGVDAVTIPNGDDLVDAVSKAIAIPADHLILTATHDHNTPFPTTQGDRRVAGAYFPVLKKGVVDAAVSANAHLQPAVVGFGTGRAYVNTNRDQKIGAGFHMGYDPKGPSDKTVAVVTFDTPAGEPIAVYANYAVHGVVMFRTHTKDGQVQITGDLPGATANYVEKALGNDAVAVWTSGAAGDQNPIFMANYNQDAPDVVDEGAAGWGILDVEARRLGEEIVRVTRATRNTTGRATLWSDTATVTCPGRRRAEPPRPGEHSGGYTAPAQVPMVASDPVNIPLKLVMINDIALAGVSGEVFTEIGEHLKRVAPFDRTMMVTHLPNGIGYIPTDKAFLLPSEKALTNRLAPGCAEPAMVDAFVTMMDKYRTNNRGDR